MTDWLAEALASVAIRDSEQPVPIVPLVPERGQSQVSALMALMAQRVGAGRAPYDGPYAKALTDLVAANPTDERNVG